ncbi:MAG: YggS family pyridoxal phosphate-dependent enzyme [Caldisericia bacterium]|nr:YggS family pyridoxal phosphate-dependent enzyme [Caldisericia bacterium]
MSHEETLSLKLRNLHETIQEYAIKSGRDPSAIHLMCVSKKATSSEIMQAIQSGETLFGENYAQDAIPKIQTIQQEIQHLSPPPKKTKFHFIGHLQQNKVKKIIPAFHRVDSVDSVQLANVISTTVDSLFNVDLCKTIPYPYPILLEIKTSKDTSKYGIAPQEVPSIIESILPMKHLQIEGFMTMATFTDQESEIRRCFSLLRSTKEEVESKFRIPFPVLSMGMTNDYPYAIQEGSTLLRIGSAIFGGSYEINP